VEAGGSARAPVLSVAGLSAAGKTRFLRALARSARTAWLPEPWTSLRPRPSLGVDRARTLLALERRLLREEARRWQRAERWARAGRTVWLDTPPIGPLTYGRGLGALLGLPWRAPEWLARPGPRSRAPEPVRMTDLVVYLRARPLDTLRRALDRPPSPDTGHEAQHLLVGLIEEEFWLGEFRRAFPGRLAVTESREAVAALVRRAPAWTEQAARLGPFGSAERVRLAALLARPARLPSRFGPAAANR
jgi:hypothetical protein